MGIKKGKHSNRTSKQTPNQKAWKQELSKIKRRIKNLAKRGYIFDNNLLPSMPKQVKKKSIENLKREYSINNLYKKAKYYDTKTGDVTTGVRGLDIERSNRAKKAAHTRKRNAIKKTIEKYSPIDTSYAVDPNTYDTDTEPTIDIDTGLEFETFEPDYEPTYGINENEIPRESDTVIERVAEQLDRWTPVKINWDTFSEVDWEIKAWKPEEYWTEYWTNIKRQDKNKAKHIFEGAIASDGAELVAWRLQQEPDIVNNCLSEILYGSGGKYGRNVIDQDLMHFSQVVKGRPLTIEESIELTELSEGNELEGE